MQHIASDRTEQGPVSQNSSAEQSSEPNQAGTEHNSDSAIGANSYVLNRTNEPLKQTENHVYQTTGRFPETPFLPLPLASRIIGVPTSGTFQNKYLLSSTCFRAPVSNETEIVEKGTKSHKRKNDLLSSSGLCPEEMFRILLFSVQVSLKFYLVSR